MNAAIADLIGQFDAADREATSLIASLTPEQAAWSRERGCWSVLDCLRHTRGVISGRRVRLRVTLSAFIAFICGP